MAKYRVCVVGASGYAGAEAAHLLARHPHVARVDTPESSAGLAGVAADVDAVLLATPAEVAAEMAASLVARGLRVVDLSGAHRAGTAEAHRAAYGFDHPHPAMLAQACYGLGAPADVLANAQLVANPGCYANGMLSALLPLFRANLLPAHAVADVTGISGVSGAGKKSTARTHFMAVAENLMPYKALRAHQHLVEVERAVPVRLLFVPMVAPLRRGMLISGSVPLVPGATQDDLDALPPLDAFWRRSATAPDVHEVAHTPWIAVHYALDPASQRLLFVTTLDNLLRGAASQAIANLNAMWQLPETTGLN
jgi:N-acetyl-gamma-glutamyl-phosphate reductase